MIELKPIQTLSCEKIIREITTEGSAPLLVLGEDTNFYYAKSCRSVVPRIELINEVLCGYLAQCWGLKVPNFNLISISQDVVDAFVAEKGSLSKRYNTMQFEGNSFFASQKIKSVTELEQYFNGFSKKSEFQLFHDPLDLLKIGAFDVWVGNKDRKKENPNILIVEGDGGFWFSPIDHTAAFSYCTNYQHVNEIFVFLEDRFRILNIPLVKSIAKFESRQHLNALKTEIADGIKFAIENLDFIYDQIPTDWGFSKRAKQHLKDFLTLEERNNRVSESYIHYIK